jgi:hypothetical protein
MENDHSFMHSRKIFISLLLILGFFVVLEGFAVAQTDYSAWSDSGIVYTAPSGDAYYPSVIFDTNGFGTGSPLYKMWYSDGLGAVYVATSTNGTSWGSMATATGLGGDAHHIQVLYDALCFGASLCNASSVKYKIWYWDTTASVYSINAISYAESTDGINWSNDQAITQDATMQLVTGAGIGWNRGSYGPVFLFYQPGASNSGTEPWNYSYVMYYDGTDGSSEITGLAYSSNGLHWIAYSGNPVLNKGSGPAWDCDDSAYGTVYQATDGYHFWYSGGGGDNGSGSCASGAPISQGIGHASSPDGKSWTKDPKNPIFYITDGVSYRNSRVYTPSVVNDGSGFLKMFYSAQALGSSQPKKIGLATLDITAPSTTAAPSGGTYSVSQSVTLTCDDGTGSGCGNIYYTTDGFDPTTASAVYSSPINISTNTTLKFFAVDVTGNEETFQTKIYIIDSSAPSTTAAPSGGTYSVSQSVTLTCNDGTGSGCDKIYHTTDGSTPTTSSPVYSSSISISTNITLKFFARDLAGNSEAVKTETYIIQFADPLIITTSSLPSGHLDFGYSETLTATGGVLSYIWAISSGNLPNGLTLNSLTGTISGTPTATGIFDFTGKVTDANVSNVYKNLSITVLSYPVRIASPLSYYLNIQDAYDACFNANIIQIGATEFIEDLYLDKNVSIILKGGYDSNYNNNSSYTAVKGKLTITHGTVEIENLIIQ